MVYDLLHPSAEEEAQKHKLSRLVQSPNSYFMDLKCQGCFEIHAQTVVVCKGYCNRLSYSCQKVLCQPTGGKAKLAEAVSFRRKY